MKALVHHGARARPSQRSPTRNRRRARSASPPSGRSGDGALSRDTETWLGPEQARALLEAYRVPLERLATSAGEAVAAAADIGFPMVVKRAGAAAPAQELVTRPAAAIPQRMHGNPAGELSASPDVRSRLLADTPAKQDGRSKK